MQETIKEIIRYLQTYRWHILSIVGLVILPLIIWGVITIRSLYLVNTEVINKYLDAQALNYPAGIYASPRRLIVGQQLTLAEIVERLQRAGYEEGMQTNDFAAGNFYQLNNTIELHTGTFATSDKLPPIVRVTAKGNVIAGLLDVQGNKQLTEIALPAEMLSADFASRRQTRRAASLDELPQTLIQALLAAEDQRFFQHIGIDPKGILRAALHNVRLGNIGQGASTLTQQLVKNHFLSPERTFTRKINEMMMAIALEQRLTKQQILSLYCDRVYLGHSGITSVYGFKQGARVYFGKELKDLTVAESALLVGLIKAPNRYSPYADQQKALARRNLVLNEMVEAGYLNPADCAAAQQEQLAVLPPAPPDATSAPYFIDYVRREMDKLESREHLQVRVETSLDMDLQQAANEAVQKNLTRLTKLLSKNRKAVAPEAALIALHPKTGEILAMTGGRDYTTSQLNRATDAFRQPGSVFKPIVYAAALSQGIGPTTTFMNAPQEFVSGQTVSYRPQNYGRSYTHQPVMLREAMVRSLNVVTVEAALQVGLGNIARMAGKMGLPRPETYPSMALGAFEATPLQIASAYTTFANRGLQVAPNPIRAIRRQGQLESQPEPVRTGVLSSTVAYLVTDALADVVNRGTATRIRQMGYRGAVAGKTGTSRDAWFVGYTPQLVIVVWVGNDDHEDLRLTGGEAAVPIWTDFIKRVAQLRPDLVGGKFESPVSTEVVKLCATSGGVANEYCGHQQRLSLPASMIPPDCHEHQAPVLLFHDEATDSYVPGTHTAQTLVNAPKPVALAVKPLPETVRMELEKMNWIIREQ
ncbi:MAG TPA: PBP1A family penicillin-binding protein [Blastocatellia bacterium]|nr:PBP1A family penicillin-binding protein [Blastocatellia bacterium]